MVHAPDLSVPVKPDVMRIGEITRDLSGFAEDPGRLLNRAVYAPDDILVLSQYLISNNFPLENSPENILRLYQEVGEKKHMSPLEEIKFEQKKRKTSIYTNSILALIVRDIDKSGTIPFLSFPQELRPQLIGNDWDTQLVPVNTPGGKRCVVFLSALIHGHSILDPHNREKFIDTWNTTVVPKFPSEEQDSVKLTEDRLAVVGKTMMALKNATIPPGQLPENPLPVTEITESTKTLEVEIPLAEPAEPEPEVDVDEDTYKFLYQFTRDLRMAQKITSPASSPQILEASSKYIPVKPALLDKIEEDETLNHEAKTLMKFFMDRYPNNEYYPYIVQFEETFKANVEYLGAGHFTLNTDQLFILYLRTINQVNQLYEPKTAETIPNIDHLIKAFPLTSESFK